MKHTLLSLLALLSAASTLFATEPGFVSLSDGKTFKGWKMANEHTNTWTIQDGAFVAHGDRCHLFYAGPLQPFKDFELKIDVMTEPGSNGGIYFDTRYQEEGWPKYGFESQVNVSHGDPIKTGSLYEVVNVKETPAKDNEWWTQTITVKGKHVTVKINDKVVVDYTEPEGKQPGTDFKRVIEPGTIALQGHDPKSVVRYKNIRVKKLD